MKKTGYDLLRDPFMNKGTAFTLEGRKENGLTGLLPPAVETIDQQADRVYAQYKSEHPGIEKRRYLMEIFNDNRTLFFHAFRKHVAEWMPVVYDPVIAESIETYSDKYVKPQYAAFLSIDHPEEIEETLKKAAEGRKIKLIVVTDAEAILGIGDWGVNGVDISIGKLMVYTAAAGLDPSTVLPVILDCGTDRKKLLDDPMYLGNSHPRVRNASYDAFVDRFVKAVENEFPGVYLHFEDFGREHAAEILEKYINDYPVFNDDRQGTGIITLAGLIGAMHISGKNLTDQVYMCFGAGTAGCGIVTRIWREMMDEGLSEEEARSRFYMVDKQGLLFDDMDDLTPEQKPFARKRSEFEHPEALTTLEAAVEAIHPTILVGTSTAPGTFTEKIVRGMASWCDRPMIFPLSNPTELAEATAQHLIEWSDGRALIATGIPADPVNYKGVTYKIGQANNALIYPGLGLGSIAVEASRVSREMISAAAHVPIHFIHPEQPGEAVFPPVSLICEFTKAVAACAVKQGLNRIPVTDVKKAVEDVMWDAEYTK